MPAGAHDQAKHQPIALELSADDERWLQQSGLSAEAVRGMVAKLRSPKRYVPFVKAATRGDGIAAIDDAEALARRFSEVGRVPGKFTPASGAASRMFGFVERALAGSPREGDHDKVARLVAGLDPRRPGPKLPFARELAAVLARRGQPLYELIDKGRHAPILAALLAPDGLGFRGRPKAVIPFHTRGERAVLPLEEHMEEALAYAGSDLHITISPEHERMIAAAVDGVRKQRPDLASVRVRHSFQRSSTDSIAIDAGTSELVRDDEGRIALFPAGHGALLPNLEEGARAVFLRNIDNLPRALDARALIERYHRAFAVLLARAKDTVARTLSAIEAGTVTQADLDGALEGLRRAGFGLLLDPDAYAGADEGGQRELARAALARPMRVVGVVRNEGEPGGGPFVMEHLGARIISILEKAEIAPERQAEMAVGEFFNPVDILADPTDHRGGVYPLARFTNAERYFVVRKPYRGRDVLRLEHPGLWNGAMDGWTSLFVELPAATFAPVKEVIDLLRPEHQDA